jgi:hypothetical protein
LLKNIYCLLPQAQLEDAEADLTEAKLNLKHEAMSVTYRRQAAVYKTVR